MIHLGYLQLELGFSLLYFTLFLPKDDGIVNPWKHVGAVTVIYLCQMAAIKAKPYYKFRVDSLGGKIKRRFHFLRLLQDHYTLKDIDADQVEGCQYCMVELTKPGGVRFEGFKTKQYDTLKHINGIYTVTPGNHSFHYTCLYAYLESYPECPKCLGKLGKIERFMDESSDEG